MNKILRFLSALFLCIFFSHSSASAELPDGTKYVQARLIANVATIQPSDGEKNVQPQIGVLFRIERGWHIYWKDSGEAAQPTVVNWQLPAGWQIGELQWPKPMKFVERGNITTYGYRDEVLLFANLPNPDVIPQDGESVTLRANVHWLVCKDICVPGKASLSLDMPFSTSLPLEPSAELPLFEKYSVLVPAAGFTKSDIPLAPPVIAEPNQSDTSLLLVLVSAFFAGMLLNLMPCVLPVLSIKVLSLVERAEETKINATHSALACMAGVLTSFLALGVSVIVLKNFGKSVGWGFQFQYPEFVVVLITLVFVLSLAFFDLYTVIVPGCQDANRAVSKIKNHFAQQFFDGILVTALSTPCTAPFLGTALAFAFTQNSFFVIAIFLTIGFGLSLPYVVLASNERLLHLLPKPGDWMHRFREFMGFLLLGTVIWLLYVLSKLTEDGVTWALVSLLVLYVLLWAKRTVDQSAFTARRKQLVSVTLIGLCVLSFYYLWPKMTVKRGVVSQAIVEGDIRWEPFSEQRLSQLQAARTPVFLDFTAEWCITCKANEHLVINTNDVAKTIKDNNFIAMRADWTTGDEAVTAALHQYGGHGVPLYVVSGGELSEPIILPTVLTKDILLEALNRVR